MLRRLSLISLALVGLISSEVWALGLGDIRLDSALNEPLRADIELLSATPEELSNLEVSMANGETFDRYGLDRPAFLSDIDFMVVDGVIEVRSRTPIAEPFVTFLVDATWSSGHLLREYTILLDPPTFAPQSQSQPAVTAPQRSAPADSGRIEREPTPAAQAQPRQAAPAATQAPAQSEPAAREPATDRSVDEAASDDVSYDSTAGDSIVAQGGMTLWGITAQVKPDSRLTMNQTMLAIFEANPDAFGGNINLLRAGSTLRIPSADEIFQIGRGDALSEIQRQHAAWGTGTVDTTPVDQTPQPNLQLVPPDDDVVLDDSATDDAGFDPEFDADPLGREQEIEQRISDLEAADVPEQQSLIEIRDSELATLRQELAQIRGEVYDPVDETPVEDEIADELVADTDTDEAPDDETETAAPTDADTTTDDEVAVDIEPPAQTGVVTTRAASKPSLIDRAIGILTSKWTMIGGGLLIVGGLLLGFMRRRRDDGKNSEAWNAALDEDEISGGELMSATETLRVPTRDDESFVVVEQESAIRSPSVDDTIEAPVDVESGDATSSVDSLEDTFSSETAINLDESDPTAEADFHMAYGLYDQAADLINGALEVEPERQDLLTKLCEIYFVWGNRDAFVDAAGRLQATISGGEDPDWDKIVIMGQQIASDHDLFAGAAVAGATRAVDLSFEAGGDDASALDMDLGQEGDGADFVIDLGMDETVAEASDEGIDFLFDGDGDGATGDAAPESDGEIDVEATRAVPTVDPESLDATAEMPTAELSAMDIDDTLESGGESPTVEQQFDVMGGTAELPSLNLGDKGLDGEAIAGGGHAPDETAEINLDDLGLDISGLEETALASLDDLDATSENEALLDLDADSVEELTDVGMDDSLLDATGLTQVLSEDLAVETTSDLDADVDSLLADSDATMLAPGYGDDETVEAPVHDDETMLAGLDEEDDFDFAKTEALPPDVFTGNASLDETGELPAVASTDFDLDLDDLTAALKISELGDTVDQPRDDATVEQPRPDVSGSADANAETMELAPAANDVSEDLHDARTMTEVGTKLDLARAYVDMGDPAGARSILEEVLDEGDDGQRQQAQQLLDSLP